MNKFERLEKVENLFHAALELEPSDVAEFIADACAGDVEIQKEVESLLAIYNQGENQLEMPVIELSAVAVADFVLKKQIEERVEGQTFGNYRIVKEVGRGGMSAVYLAVRDDSQYQKRVAVKLLKKGVETDAAIERFRKERQILANLEHPNIARLIDGGTTSEGFPYLVMEYVKGLSISLYCELHRLSAKERLKLFGKVCSAIEFAHQNLIVHRDIKPSNILITEQGVPKILDFGIAKAIHESLFPQEATPTATELRVMTPEYASPEQVRGEHVTASSDVYSLGVLLYELLTGRRPYYFKSKSPYEIARVVCEKEPEKPTTIIQTGEIFNMDDSSSAPASNGKKQMRRLAGDLENILLKSLRKEPERRYISVAEFSEDIQRYLKNLPVKARKDTLVYRSAKFFKRHRVSVLTTFAAALLCLLIGLSFSIFTTRREVRESVAVIPFDNTNQDSTSEYLSGGITDNLINQLSRLPRLVVKKSNSKFNNQGQEIDLKTLSSELNVQTILTGSVISEQENISIYVKLVDTTNNQPIWSKRYIGRSSEILTIQKEILQDVSRNLGVTINVEELKQKGGTENADAYNLYLKGQYFWNQRSGPALGQALDYFQQAIEKDSDYALAYSGLSNTYFLLSVWGMVPAEEAFPKARAASLKALEIEPELAEAHLSLAVVFWQYEWDWESADREFKAAVELNPNYALAPHWYGLYLGEMGRFDEAVESENRALKIDPLSVPINADLARVLYYARRYDESLAQFQKTIELNPIFSNFQGELCELYEQMKMEKEWYAAMDKVGGFIIPTLKEAFGTGGMEGYRRRLVDFFRTDKFSNYYAYYPKAQLYAQLGEKNKAFEALNEAYEFRDHRMAQLKVNPKFDNLRSDPRYTALLKRMKLNE